MCSYQKECVRFGPRNHPGAWISTYHKTFKILALHLSVSISSSQRQTLYLQLYHICLKALVRSYFLDYIFVYTPPVQLKAGISRCVDFEC